MEIMPDNMCLFLPSKREGEGRPLDLQLEVITLPFQELIEHRGTHTHLVCPSK